MVKEIHIDGEFYNYKINKYVEDDDEYILFTRQGEIYVKNKVIHRDDGPAVIYNYGSKEWWINGKLHRIDGPAIESYNGKKMWFINGELHRIDGPAIDCGNGDEEWYQNGKHHRINGPAVIYKEDKTESWYYKGKLHRLDGPAINLTYYTFDDYCEICNYMSLTPKENKIHYFINSIEYTDERYYKIVKLINKNENKLVNKYARVWYEICDQPGKKLWDIKINEEWKNLEELYI
jgi:hypothetical protein